VSDAVLHEDEFSEPSPSEWVYFSVVGNPRAGYTYEEFPEHLTPSSLHESLPTQDTRAEIVQTLTRLKFEVDDGHGATVTARGSVALFREVFDIELVHRRRTTRTPSGEWTSEAVVPKNAGTRISTLRLPGALFVAVAEPPTPLAPRLPPPCEGMASICAARVISRN
jgi:hypothetical protein